MAIRIVEEKPDPSVVKRRVCGKGVKQPWRWTVEIYDGGAKFKHKGENISQGFVDEEFMKGYIGYVPVGREC